MESVEWLHSTAMEPDDVMVSDNLIQFVKEDDIVSGLDTQDDILPQDIFNEIINKFDFDENDVNINSFLNDLNAAADNDTPFIPRNIDDPLLSSSNASINYNDFAVQPIVKPTTIKQQQQQHTTIPQQITHVTTTNTTSMPQIISSSPTHIATPENSNQLETVIYQIANTPISGNSFVATTTTSMQSQQVLNGLTPIQMVFNNVDTTNFQPTQKYSEVSETKTQPLVMQSGALLNTNKVVENNGKSIILQPTVVYANATPVSSNSVQSVQLINTTNGTILTQVPVSTIMVEQEPQKPPKVKEKRSTHNAIERRYRTSINDKIVELKNMLVGEEGKLNKSAILKKSIEKINDLEGENYELRLQNTRLRELLLAQGPIATDESSLKTLLLERTVNPHKRRYTNSSIGSGSDYGNTSPPTSDESNPSLSPTHSDTSSMPLSPLGSDEMSTEIDCPPKRNKKSDMENITTHGMSSISKLTLCAFMFAVITINPLASLLSDSSPSNGANIFDEKYRPVRRGILTVDSNNVNFFQGIWQQFSNSFLAFILNIILLTVCLVKLCYHSDPIMNFRSPAADKYFKQKLIADTEFDQGNASAALKTYKKCLAEMFGVVLPQSWFELIPMTIWQFLRCCVHRLRVGPWLSKWIRSDETQKDALNSAQELAIILNRCNQIHLSQNISDGCGLILSMYAVNMAEVARNIAPLTLIDVYLTAALRCRKNYVYFFSWMCSRYYLYKARNEATLLCGQKLPPKYNWIFNNAHGYRFICKFSFDTITENIGSPSIFSSEINSLDTLSVVFACYNEHLLKCALQCLVGVSYTSNSEIKSCIAIECNDETIVRDVLNYSELLKENCKDPLTLWWSNLFSMDACWLLGDDALADKMFEDVVRIPKALLELKDPLARTAVTIFCAKKLLAMKKKESVPKIWSLCNCASKMFTESLVYNKTTKSDMTLFVQLLICDWLLETRTSCWEMERNSKTCSDDDNNNTGFCNPSLQGKQLEQFQADLNNLNCIIVYIPTAKSRIYLYEAVSRLMAGAAPGYTQELLDRSFHEQYRRNNRSTFHCGSGNKEIQNNSSNENLNRRRCGQNSPIAVDGERERATAMYVACKYLPTPLLCLPGERVGMLAEAAKTLKKIGNRKKLNDCYKLMQSFRATTVSTD